jgi:hypothetical protein
VQVYNCCDPFSVGTRTYVKSIETCVESVLPLNLNYSQKWIVFLLFW